MAVQLSTPKVATDLTIRSLPAGAEGEARGGLLSRPRASVLKHDAEGRLMRRLCDISALLAVAYQLSLPIARPSMDPTRLRVFRVTVPPSILLRGRERVTLASGIVTEITTKP
jgi:hypothetical protein